MTTPAATRKKDLNVLGRSLLKRSLILSVDNSVL